MINMTIYTPDEYNKMMESILKKIKLNRTGNWEPVDLDKATDEFPIYNF